MIIMLSVKQRIYRRFIINGGAQKICSRLLLEEPKYRVGTGYDIHKFVKTQAKNFINSCGIEIEHNMAIETHSDGDVATHAVINKYTSHSTHDIICNTSRNDFFAKLVFQNRILEFCYRLVFKVI